MGYPHEREYLHSSSWESWARRTGQLPYGTMTDDEMRAMPIPMLQDEGLLFLWVTGRAMEIGRQCLHVWGYTRVDEVVWVKTNQVCLFSVYVFYR